MEIKQFYDEGLAHAAYAILSHNKVALIDPGRDPQPYLDYINEHHAQLIAVFETHPHADFVSAHLELQKRFGVKVYINDKAGVSYTYEPFNDGDMVKLGAVSIKAVYTPGHAPDHNALLLYDEQDNIHAVFTGDSLFVGDVGRPDLRENAGKLNPDKKTLAAQMYDTMQNFYKLLDDDVIIYPAHGAGSACGKNMVAGETYSTIGKERKRNWAMGSLGKEDFIAELLADQPDVPKYFPFDVEENRKGVQHFRIAVDQVRRIPHHEAIAGDIMIIDARSSEAYKEGHLPGAINIPLEDKFETWLGYLLSPGEAFYLVAGHEHSLNQAIERTAKIGYEKFIKGAKVMQAADKQVSGLAFADYHALKNDPEQFTIIDVRNKSEVEGRVVFANSINIPLARLRSQTGLIPRDKPVAVHCAGGYRSAIAAGILEQAGYKPVYDIGEQIKLFQHEKPLV